jgi:hypothetical protein
LAVAQILPYKQRVTVLPMGIQLERFPVQHARAGSMYYSKAYTDPC